MQKTKQRTLTEEFQHAVTSYEEASNAWHSAAEMARDAQSDLRTLQQRLDTDAFALRLDPRIEGKNAQEREASYQVILAGDNPYQATLKELEQAKTGAQRWNDEAARARDQMALRKRIMDWVIAQLNFKAAKGGENGRRNHQPTRN